MRAYSIQDRTQTAAFRKGKGIRNTLYGVRRGTTQQNL